MKIYIAIILIVSALVSMHASARAVETITNEPPVAVAGCDKPLDSYKCYDTNKNVYCQGVNLFYLRGYCPGGNNIQCCAPKGFPEGPRVNGPGITDYGRCDAGIAKDTPNADYRCYDTNEIPGCPNPNQKFVRGWCPGGNNIQCCAPPGTPEGVRTGGPGVEIELGPETKTADFDLLLEGLLSCEYTVKSSGAVTKKSKFACNERVKITVGPGKDCRDEGRDTCEVINDGGFLGVTKSYKFSIKFVKPAKNFGPCEKYSEFSCVLEADCKATGGTPLPQRGYCPNAKDQKVKCCIHHASFNIPGRGVFVVDRTKDKIISDVAGLDAKLKSINEKFNAEIKMEILDDISASEERAMRNKFHIDFELDKSPAKLSMVIVYLKSRNSWPVIQRESCGIDQKTFEEIVANVGVEQNINQKSYDEALKAFVDLLSGVISKRAAAGDVCRKSASEGSCQKQCGSLLGCSLEKCVNIDGCTWNENQNGAKASSGSCEDICPGVYQEEVSLIKRSEDCGGVKCHDAYVCRNGKVVDGPIEVAASRTTAAYEGEITGSCEGIPNSFITKYNQYRNKISEAISAYDLGGIDNPQAFVAAVISKESAWNERALSGSSTGLMQINIPAHPECDAERIGNFDSETNIECGVRFLAQLAGEKQGDVSTKVYACKGQTYRNIEGVILRYYNGWPAKCLNDPSREDENFVEDILGYRNNPKYTANYPRWKSCLSKSSPDVQGNIDLPEGTFRITETARISGSEGETKYFKPSGEQFAPQCNIAPETGISGYWFKLYSGDERIGQCTGLHGLEPPAQSCSRFVGNNEIARLFSAVRSGAYITIKDPYRGGDGGIVPATSDSNIAGGSVRCSSVCSGILESIGKIVDSSGCQKRCRQMGCEWSGGKCAMKISCAAPGTLRSGVIDLVSYDVEIA